MTMTFTRLLATAGLAALLLSQTALAQTATPAPSAAPAMTAPMAAPMSMDKQNKSKMCSDEADKQGLHGKARKTFRSKCKSGKM